MTDADLDKLTTNDYLKARIAALGALSPHYAELVVLTGELVTGLIARSYNPLLEQVASEQAAALARLEARFDALDARMLEIEYRLGGRA